MIRNRDSGELSRGIAAENGSGNANWKKIRLLSITTEEAPKKRRRRLLSRLVRGIG